MKTRVNLKNFVNDCGLYFPVFGNLRKKSPHSARIWENTDQKKLLIFTLFTHTAGKVSKYIVFHGPYFPVFGLNAAIYSVNLCIQSKYRKIRTRKILVFGHFSRSDSGDTSNILRNNRKSRL